MTELIFLGVGAIRPDRPGEHTAFLLRYGKANVLIDAGPAVMMQLDRVGVKPEEITHIYLSHQHGDHVLGSPVFLFYHAPRYLLAAHQVIEAWQAMVDAVYPHIMDILNTELELHPLPSHQPHMWPNLPGVCARLALVHHANLPAYALRLDFPATTGENARSAFSLVYSGDTSPTESVTELAKDADLLIHEATYLETEHPQGDGIHSSAEQAGAIAKAAGVKKLALVHRSAGDPAAWIERASRAFDGEIIAPSPGDRLSLPI
ncbi:MAG: MBL fold metallo-hydrolase [Chloroflexi bacterium]|nr:MBL fold metallo-hydrolase [Chloroflexota bacterium]